ncbi:hypothetical protein [Arcanobacterium pluranimalium]|uniref:hypothetical protein n=1 Tax=Arcanobacterium pluranimalium TaxID=108028 RepID=UPI00308430CF
MIVPLLIASSLKLDAATTIHLINADLFTCGLATLIQSVGIGRKMLDSCVLPGFARGGLLLVQARS